MATVYLGRRVEGAPAGEVVALKVIKDELAGQTEYVHMFLDEAKILSRLSHPDIIETREFGVTEESRFIAMELLLGRSLMDAWDRCAQDEGRIPLDLAAWIAARVADALQHAHELADDAGAPLHVIHRDVNLTNVFLTYDGRVKLIDFGLAKARGRLARSGEGIVKGKVPYLSPEQIAEQPIDHRTDIYALGATLWEMTTGRRLFKRETDLETLKAVRAQEIPDPRNFVEGLYPEAMWRIVDTALRRERNERYPSAREMGADLDTFLAKYGRKTSMGEVLTAWLEELFPGERAEQEAWLAKARAAAAPPPGARLTMRPPVPVAEVEEEPTATSHEVEEVAPAPVARPSVEPTLPEAAPAEEAAPVPVSPPVAVAPPAAPPEPSPPEAPANAPDGPPPAPKERHPLIAVLVLLLTVGAIAGALYALRAC